MRLKRWHAGLFVAIGAIAGLRALRQSESPRPVARETLRNQDVAHHSVGTISASNRADAKQPIEVLAQESTSRFKERPSDEWQGMLVDLAISPPCPDSEHCGLARACIEGVCTACERDADCADGEACVLDHCVDKNRVTCRERADCQNGAICILTGYSGGPRGNDEMSAECSDYKSGSNRDADEESEFPLDDSDRIVAFGDELARAHAAYDDSNVTAPSR